MNLNWKGPKPKIGVYQLGSKTIDENQRLIHYVPDLDNTGQIEKCSKLETQSWFIYSVCAALLSGESMLYQYADKTHNM